MQVKHFLGAVALAAATLSAQAENLTINVPMVANTGMPGSFSGGFGVTHVQPGAFTDTLTFIGAASGFVSASLVTLGFQNDNNINFTSVTLNGRALTLSGTGAFETGNLAPTFLSAPFVMTVSGIAGPGVQMGNAIAASYAGTMNVSQVPEPTTSALWLAGLGAVGWLARRRATS